MSQDIFNFPLKKNKKQKYLLYDYETESLNMALSRPWQLAFAEFTLEHDKIWGQERYIWWDDLHVSQEAALATKFNYVFYKSKAEPGKAVLDDFEKYANDDQYIVMGHNTFGFDHYIHTRFRKGLGLKPNFAFLDRSIDTNCLARAWKFERPIDLKNLQQLMFKFTGEYKRGVKTSIKELAKEFGIEYDETKHHASALYDIELTWEIFKKVLERVTINE